MLDRLLFIAYFLLFNRELLEIPTMFFELFKKYIFYYFEHYNGSRFQLK